MARGISKELEKEIRKVLEELVNSEPGGFNAPTFATPALELDAVHYLADIGAFRKEGAGSYRLTAQGREYWEKINTPAPCTGSSETGFLQS